MNKYEYAYNLMVFVGIVFLYARLLVSNYALKKELKEADEAYDRLSAQSHVMGHRILDLEERLKGGRT